jgi:hypothetical protein
MAGMELKPIETDGAPESKGSNSWETS